MREKIIDFLKRHPKIKNALRWMRFRAFFLINLILFPLFKRYYFKKLNSIPETTQIFLLCRHDVGYHVLFLNYIDYWEKNRGTGFLFILTPHVDRATKFIHEICPDIEYIAPNRILCKIISYLFNEDILKEFCLFPIYHLILHQRPDSVVLYDAQHHHPSTHSLSIHKCRFPRVPYNPYFDERFLHPSISKLDPIFVNTYKKFRTFTPTNFLVYHDYIKLFYSNIAPKPSEKLLHRVDVMKQTLGIFRKYITINLNCKNYGNEIANRRSIKHPDRFNSVIDLIINRGYDVVIHGRTEQPYFKPRKGLIDYSKSSIPSIENDLAIFCGCEGVIVSKSGPEIFGTVFDKPTLGINYTDCCHSIPNKRMRYFFKHFYDKTLGKTLSWQELLNHPCFFQMGELSFIGSDQLECIEMSEQELIESTEEFLDLLPLSEDEWVNYSPLQRQFRSMLTPLHLDLPAIKGVPCEAYLKLDSSTLARAP